MEGEGSGLKTLLPHLHLERNTEETSSPLFIVSFISHPEALQPMQEFGSVRWGWGRQAESPLPVTRWFKALLKKENKVPGRETPGLTLPGWDQKAYPEFSSWLLHQS